MAKLRVFSSIDNDIYSLTFVNDPVALSQQDKALMQRFGEPQINKGGTFGSGEDSYTLPDCYIGIRTDFPYTQLFDAKGAPFDSNTVVKVEAYKTAITTAFTDALITLRENDDTFSGETVTNI